MADIEVQMEGIVEPTYNKRRKGYVFKKGWHGSVHQRRR
jgi:hypothetical protein